jgi:large subunit ribosomal protein L30
MGRLKVSWVKSDIGYNERQKRTIAALGLKRLNHAVILDSNPAVLGMVAKVRHLVTVEPAPGEPEE